MCARLDEIQANVNGPEYCAYLYSLNCEQRDDVRLCWYTNRKGDNFEKKNEKQNPMIFNGESGRKPHFWPILGIFGLFLAPKIFSSKIGLRHFTPLHGP